MTLISGIPPWVQMYFDWIVARTGRPVGEVFPQFDLFVYGGVNFEPYRKKLFDTIGRPVDSVELFPASEGFLAFQDEPGNPGLLLLLNAGIFYEFIPAERFFEPNPPRLTLAEVELDRQYALVLTSNAGLWGYSPRRHGALREPLPVPGGGIGPHQALPVGFRGACYRRGSGAGPARSHAPAPGGGGGGVYRCPPRQRRPGRAIPPRVAHRIRPPTPRTPPPLPPPSTRHCASATPITTTCWPAISWFRCCSRPCRPELSSAT